MSYLPISPMMKMSSCADAHPLAKLPLHSLAIDFLLLAQPSSSGFSMMLSRKVLCLGTSTRMRTIPLNFQSNSDLKASIPMRTARRTSRKSSYPISSRPTFFAGKNHQTYEFYHPSVHARQLGFGQVPIRLHFADLVKPRDMVPTNIVYNQLKSLSPSLESIDLSSWRF